MRGDDLPLLMGSDSASKIAGGADVDVAVGEFEEIDVPHPCFPEWSLCWVIASFGHLSPYARQCHPTSVEPARGFGRHPSPVSASQLLISSQLLGGLPPVAPAGGEGWRRERDSNPRRAFDPYTLSRVDRVPNAVYPILEIA